jgi:hypothetical protein
MSDVLSAEHGGDIAAASNVAFPRPGPPKIRGT